MWCPQRSLERCTLSSRERDFSAGSMGGGRVCRIELGGAERRKFDVCVVCMCVLSVMPEGQGGSAL